MKTKTKIKKKRKMKTKMKTKAKIKKNKMKTKMKMRTKMTWPRDAIDGQVTLTWTRSVITLSFANFTRGLVVP